MNVETQVLQELSRDGYASGEAISKKLNITRSAVWKHIVKLREHGYRIEASPRRGYHLTGRPDKLLPAEISPLLKTAVVGKRIVHRDEIGSTTELARELIEGGTPDGTIVIAEHQTAARGRLGRTWRTPAGKAIAMSVILYPPFSPTQAPLLSLATGLAVVRGVESVAPIKPQLKWPNDIYLGGKKLGGVLVEMAAELDRIKWIMDSIGLNVNNSFEGTELENKATSLAAELGKRVSRRDLAAAILSELDQIYAQAVSRGFASLIGEFERLDMLRGQKVRVGIPEGEVTGIASGIDESGRLLVEDPEGRVHALFSGEATILL